MKKMTRKDVLTLTGMFLFWILAASLHQNEALRQAAVYTVAGKGMVRLARQELCEQLEAPRVAITFDDGPNKTWTPLLLDGLKERGVHATFFLMGKNIPGNEDIIRRMKQEGHLIGNHTYNHVQLNRVSELEAQQEIEKTSNEIYEITGYYPIYIRPPFGAWRKDMELSVSMVPVFWDIDTLDWKSQNVDSVLRIVEKELEDGSIILMHDIYKTSVEAALKLIDEFQEKGYEFVTVESLLML